MFEFELITKLDEKNDYERCEPDDYTSVNCDPDVYGDYACDPDYDACNPD